MRRRNGSKPYSPVNSPTSGGESSRNPFDSPSFSDDDEDQEFTKIEDHNRPDISPREFLLAIMRNNRFPVSVRMDAAYKVANFEHARLAQIQQEIKGGMQINISGGLPKLPGTDVIMPSSIKVNGHATSHVNGFIPDPED
jgi:hypothetical protein